MRVLTSVRTSGNCPDSFYHIYIKCCDSRMAGAFTTALTVSDTFIVRKSQFPMQSCKRDLNKCSSECAMHRPILPPEICDEICGQLASCPAALATCGQIHSSFTASARVYLFHTVVIESHIDIKAMRAVFCGPNGRQILSCVRNLSLIDNYKKSWSTIWRRPCAITDILASLRHPNMSLDSLTVVGLDYGALSYTGRAVLHAIASSTPKLNLQGVKFGNIDNLLASLAAAPMLSTLVVRDCTYSSSKVQPYMRHRAPPLTTVAMPASLLRIIVEWNSRWHSIPTIVTVDLNGNGSSDAKLTSLDTWCVAQKGLLYMVVGSDDSSGWYNPGLYSLLFIGKWQIYRRTGLEARHCLSLRSLTLHAGYVYVGNKVTEYLTSAISPCLQELNLSVYNTGGYSSIPFPGIEMDILVPFLASRPQVTMRMIIAAAKHDMKIVYKTYRLRDLVDIRVALVSSHSPIWNSFRPSFEDIFRGPWKPRSILAIQ